MKKSATVSEDAGFRGGTIVRHKHTGEQGMLIAVGGNGEWIVQTLTAKPRWMRHPREEWEVIG